MTIFFVLCGFLITTLCLREEERAGQVSLRKVFLRRAFRILPLYVLVLPTYCVLIFGVNLNAERAPNFRRALPYYVSPVPEVPHFSDNDGVPFEIAWSLGIEEKFYVLWPLLAFGVAVGAPARRARVRGTVIALACALAAPLVLGTLGLVLYEYGHILAGCLIALLLHDAAGFRRLQALGRRTIALATLATVVVVHLLRAALPNPANFLFTVAVGAVLIGLVVAHSPLSRLLERRPLLFLGKISYGLYLTHQLGLDLADRLVSSGLGLTGDFASLVVGLAGFILAVAASAVLYYGFEAPLIRFARVRYRPHPEPRTS